MRMPLSLSLFLVVSGLVRAEEEISAKTVAAIKEATVIVKCEFASGGGSGPAVVHGSGFLFKVHGKMGLIATSDFFDPRPIGTSAGSTRKLAGNPQIIFRRGTAGEKIVTADIVVADRERDLAILRVDGVDDLPVPLDLASPPEIVEARDVILFGGHPDDRFAYKKEMPPLLAVKGFIASVRKEGNVVRSMLIDGQIGVGFNGAPIFDRQGRLLGIAQTRIPFTRHLQAVPPSAIYDLFKGRIGEPTVVSLPRGQGEWEFQVVVKIVDPEDQIKEVAVLHRKGPAPNQANPDGTWSPLSEAQKVAVKLTRHEGRAEFRVKVSEETGNATVTMQIGFVNRQSDWEYSRPLAHVLSLGRSVLAKDASFKSPEAFTTGQVLTQPAKRVGGLIEGLMLTEFKQGVSAMLPCICWTPDGKGFYTLDTHGNVLRVNMANFTEARRLDIAARCSWLSLSRAGLLVTVSNRQECWLLDADTLEVKQRFELPSVTSVISNPSLGVAFVNSPRQFTTLDIAKGIALKNFYPDNLGPTSEILHTLPTPTPDGKYLFTVSTTGRLYRHRIEAPSSLLLDETGHDVSARSFGIAVGSDNKYVSVVGLQNRNLKDHPAVPPNTTFAYPVDDLRKPAVAITIGTGPQALAFDPKGEKIYTHDERFPLVVFNYQGKRTHEYRFPSPSRVTRQILPHPSGARALVLTEDKLYHVELDQ